MKIFKSVLIIILMALPWDMAFGKPGNERGVFIGRDVNGSNAYTGSYHGEILVLLFWIAEGERSRAALLEVENLQRELLSEDIKTVVVHRSVGNCMGTRINCDTRRISRLQGVLEGLKVSLTIDIRDMAFRRFGVSNTPTIVVVGKEGKIKGVFQNLSDSKFALIRKMILSLARS